jgi:HSP20 family protein
MALTPYKPFNALFPAVDRLFENFLNPDLFDTPALNLRGTVPAVNIRETDTAFEIEVAAPGLQKEDFRLEVENEVLKISAQKETQSEQKADDGKYHRREFAFTSFQRSFTLPKHVEVDQIGAVYTDGVLKVALPKPEAKAKVTKTIEIG